MNNKPFPLSVFVLVALVCWTGCVTTRVLENTRVPELVADDSGGVTFNDQRLEVGKIASAVRSAGITREQEVNILVPENFDRNMRNAIYADMIKGGYTRTIFVTNRKATAAVLKKK